MKQNLFPLDFNLRQTFTL